MVEPGTDEKPSADALDGIHWSLQGRLTYGGYLKLEPLLHCQVPLSTEHDELLFIVIHQSTELWMKLCLHEMDAARRQIRLDDIEPAFKMLSRVARIQAQMIQSWDILATMTPADYLRFRNVLGPSSGFQSHQYRLLEFMLGAKNRALIAVHRNEPAIHDLLQQMLEAPSLYDESLRLLARRGLPVPAGKVERDWSLPYEPDPGVEAAWLTVYRAPEKFWDLYELAEKLVDFEYRFQQWRFAHLKTVERIIGFRRGTGGSSGVGYLKTVLDRSFFPELFSLRTTI